MLPNRPCPQIERPPWRALRHGIQRAVCLRKKRNFSGLTTNPYRSASMRIRSFYPSRPHRSALRLARGTRWGTRVSPSTVSDLNKKIYGTIEAWRNRPIEGEHPYVYLDGIVLKRSWAGEVRNVSLLVAIGVPTPRSTARSSGVASMR